MSKSPTKKKAPAKKPRYKEEFIVVYGNEGGENYHLGSYGTLDEAKSAVDQYMCIEDGYDIVIYRGRAVCENVKPPPPTKFVWKDAR